MQFLQDVRYAARSLARNPVLSITVAITLLIGIGLSTAVFAALDGMWFRPRVEKDPASFVQLLTNYRDGPPNRGEPWASSLDAYRAMQAQSKTVSDFAAWRVIQARVEDDPRFELSLMVTCDFFHLYGLEHASQGRLFSAPECAGTNPRVAIVSEKLWRSRFASSPGIVGARIRLNERLYTIVGVVPAQFSGNLRGGGLWVPYTSQPDLFAGRDFFQEPATPWLIVEGRMRPGYSKSDVEQEMNRILTGLAGHPRAFATNGSFAQHPALRTMMLGVVPLIGVVMAAILLMACSNVTILLLARASSRRREIAIRRALGADRRRLVQMLLAEGLLIAGVAGGAAAFLTRLIPAAFHAIFWRAPYYPVTPNGSTFLYLAAATLVAACFAGLGPGVESFRSDLSPALKKSPVFLRPRLRWQMRDLQVGALVAMSVTLVTGAALFLRAQLSLAAAEQRDQAAQTIAMTLRGPSEKLERALVERVSAIPGVDSAEVTAANPAAQQLGGAPASRYRYLVVVTHGDASIVSRQISEVVRALDPEQMATPASVQSEIHELAARFQTISNMVTALGSIALLLAVVGVYGVVSFAVSQRAQELAIRVALGARRLDIVRCVLDSGFRPIAAGLAVGIVLAGVAAVGLSVALRGAPVPMRAADPVPYLMVCAILAAASLAAMFRPAWRAASVNPASALRED